jgi:hypothetical protein
MGNVKVKIKTMSELTQNYQLFNIIGQIITILSVVFLIYKYFENKDHSLEKKGLSVDKELGISGATCEYKHRMIDEKFAMMMDLIKQQSVDMKFMKDNHLAHIEKDISSIKTDVAVILDRENRGAKKI